MSRQSPADEDRGAGAPPFPVRSLGANGRPARQPRSSWRSWLFAGGIACTIVSLATRMAASAGPAAPTWLPPETVAATDALSSDPSVAVADTGRVWVAWQDGPDVMAAVDAGQGWGARERVGAGFGVDMAIAQETPHLVFVHEVEDHVDIVYSFRDAAGWVLPRTVSSTLSLSADPAIALAGDMRYVVWADGERLFFGRSPDGAVWSVAPVLINGLPVEGTAPDVAASEDGDVDLVWHVAVEGVVRIRHAVWRAGRWSLPEELTPEGTSDKRLPSVAVLPGGDRLVVWLDGNEGAGRQVRGIIGDADWWSDPQDISPVDGALGGPQVAARSDGADVVWPVAPMGAAYRARAARGGWSPIEPVTGGEARDVTVAAANGSAYVAWSAPVDAPNHDIQLRRRVPGIAPTATPTDLPATATATATLPLPTEPATTAPTGTMPPSATPATATPSPTVVTATPTPSATATATASRRPSTSTATASATATATRVESTPTKRPATVTPSPTQAPGLIIYLPWTGMKRRPAAASAAQRDLPPDQAAAPAAQPSDDGPRAVWSAPEEVVRLPGDAWQLSVATDLAGRPHVVWEEGEVLKHTWRDVGGWHAPVQVAYGEAPSLALDADGTLHALFANTFDGNQEIYHVRFDGERWSLPETVSDTTTWSSAPTLRAGAGEVPLVATWSEQGPDGLSMIYYGFYRDGYWHTWPVTQARGQGPTLALDESGPILAWHARPVAERPFDIFAARAQSLSGGEWSLPENVSDTSEENSVVASVALDPRTWHVAWQEGPAEAAGVAYSRRYDAGWGRVESLAAESSAPPKVLAAPGGGREVVWLADTAVWSARGFGEGAWDTGKVPPAEVGAVAAAAASDEDGGLHLVWAESRSPGSVLRYARRLGCAACRLLIPLVVKNR